jgi:phytoene synthase
VARDTNFYYSFLVLPSAKRRGIIAVWDFCRAVDDAVDRAEGGEEEREAALNGWRDEVARCFAGTPITEQGSALQPFIRQFGLPRQPFYDLVDGVAMDLGRRRYSTFDELRQYCYGVASTVGLICVEIFGYTDPGARDYAVRLGQALQLTNILRDLRVDLASGRLYLPLEDLSRFGVTESDLASGLAPRVRELLAFEAARARELYAEAQRALPRRDRRSLVAAEIMSGIYRAILDRIERRGYDVFSEVVRVPRPRRAWIAATIWLRSLF